MWKPFKLQFSELLEHLQIHKDLLHLELTVASTEEAVKFYREVEERLEASEVNPFLGRSDRARSAYESGGEWLRYAKAVTF